MSFQIVHPGAFSILVDAGRPRHRSLGIPFGGAADRAAWQIGNALLGNSPEAVALEIAFSGPTLQAVGDIDVCVFGAPFRIRLDSQSCQPAATISVRAGQTLSIGGTTLGVRGYLCVAGGFKAKETLGSRCAFEPVKVKQILRCRGASARSRSLEYCDARELLETGADSDEIRVVAGPQKNWFPNSPFFEQSFQVSTSSDRMGIRLQGGALVRPAARWSRKRWHPVQSRSPMMDSASSWEWTAKRSAATRRSLMLSGPTWIGWRSFDLGSLFVSAR